MALSLCASQEKWLDLTNELPKMMGFHLRQNCIQTCEIISNPGTVETFSACWPLKSFTIATGYMLFRNSVFNDLMT